MECSLAWGGVPTKRNDEKYFLHIPGTNRLKSVTDFNNDALTKLGDFRTATTHSQYADKAALTSSSPQSSFDAITDYTYDVNGNLTLDNNKKINGITYNHLNLPSVITVTGKGTITYTYDAAGNKLRKVTVDNAEGSKGIYFFACQSITKKTAPPEAGRQTTNE